MKPAVECVAIDLQTLADQINKAHADGEATSRVGLEHYRAAGAALIAAKKQVGHGEWLNWLKVNVRVTQQQAWKYMQVAEYWPKLQSSCNLADALKIISGETPDIDPMPIDDFNFPVPNHLASAFATSASLKTIARRMREEYATISESDQADIGDEKLSVFRSIIEAIQAGRAVAVCPDCRGIKSDECRTCYGYGWINSARLANLTPEQLAVVKRFAG